MFAVFFVRRKSCFCAVSSIEFFEQTNISLSRVNFLRTAKELCRLRSSQINHKLKELPVKCRIKSFFQTFCCFRFYVLWNWNFHIFEGLEHEITVLTKNLSLRCA